MHCSRRRLLRRGLEFYVCTINKSAHTKKSQETYLLILVFNRRNRVRKSLVLSSYRQFLFLFRLEWRLWCLGIWGKEMASALSISLSMKRFSCNIWSCGVEGGLHCVDILSSSTFANFISRGRHFPSKVSIFESIWLEFYQPIDVGIYFRVKSAALRDSSCAKVVIWFDLVSLFNGISTFIGYLMPKPFS